MRSVTKCGTTRRGNPGPDLSAEAASNVGVVAAPRRSHHKKSGDSAPWSLASTLAIPGFLAIYVALALTTGVSRWVAATYIGLSIACLFAYALDKSAAIAGRWRSSEQSLLLLGLAGGWPGGLVAQKFLRHKSSKASFQRAYWVTVAINVVAFVLLHVYFRSAAM